MYVCLSVSLALTRFPAVVTLFVIPLACSPAGPIMITNQLLSLADRSCLADARGAMAHSPSGVGPH